MERITLFKEMLVQAEINNFYIGTGNPNADILIIGKEISVDPKIDKGNMQCQTEMSNNIMHWKRDVGKNQKDIENYNGSNYSPLYPYKGQKLIINNNKNGGTSRTWYNYQKLYNLIYPENKIEGIINFHEGVFITELNDSPSPKTRDANKDSLAKRKLFIKESQFFKSFKVVLIAGLGYFKIKVGENEIEDIFYVKFTDEKKIKDFPKQKYWVHQGISLPKLLINTRQLSMYVTNELLEEIAEEIKKSLHGLEPYNDYRHY